MDRQSEKNTFLGNSPILIIVSLNFFALLNCGGTGEKIVVPPANSASNQALRTDARDEQTPPSTVVNNFKLIVLNRERKCSLSYTHSIQDTSLKQGRIELEMDSPCEFVRMSDTLKPLFYSFGKGSTKHTVLIIVGGPPDNSVNDKLQPKGCGTELRRILVFDEKIEIGDKVDGNGPICPGQGLDRTWFLG